MRRAKAFVIVLLVCAGSAVSISMRADADSAMLQAGVAKVDITPPVGITMSGYGDWPSEGIHDSLRFLDSFDGGTNTHRAGSWESIGS